MRIELYTKIKRKNYVLTEQKERVVLPSILVRFSGCIADSIVLILHYIIKEHMNLEIVVNDKMPDIAIELKLYIFGILPAKHIKINIASALDIAEELEIIGEEVGHLMQERILALLFIDPINYRINKALSVGSIYTEIYTSSHFEPLSSKLAVQFKLFFILIAEACAMQKWINVNAGHHLTYHKLQSSISMEEIYRINISHAIIGQVVINSFSAAVADIKLLIWTVRY